MLRLRLATTEDMVAMEDTMEDMDTDMERGMLMLRLRLATTEDMVAMEDTMEDMDTDMERGAPMLRLRLATTEDMVAMEVTMEDMDTDMERGALMLMLSLAMVTIEDTEDMVGMAMVDIMVRRHHKPLQIQTYFIQLHKIPMFVLINVP